MPSAKRIDPDNSSLLLLYIIIIIYYIIDEILIRDDGVTVIDFPNGIRLTTHKDETKFMCSPDDS